MSNQKKSISHLCLTQKLSGLTKAVYMVGLVAIALPAVAQAPVPSQDFWDYLSDYSDDNGDVLDPLEYDQLLSMKNSSTKQTDEDEDGQSELDTSVDSQQIRNADMKIKSRSSTQASSSTVKGAAL